MDGNHNACPLSADQSVEAIGTALNSIDGRVFRDSPASRCIPDVRNPLVRIEVIAPLGDAGNLVASYFGMVPPPAGLVEDFRRMSPGAGSGAGFVLNLVPDGARKCAEEIAATN